MEHAGGMRGTLMQKIEITKRDLAFLGILSAIAAVFTVVWMALTGNSPQVYKDIVSEWTARVRSNKSAEITLLRLLILLGSAGVFLYGKFLAKKNPAPMTEECSPDTAISLVAWICSIIVLKLTR